MWLQGLSWCLYSGCAEEPRLGYGCESPFAGGTVTWDHLHVLLSQIAARLRMTPHDTTGTRDSAKYANSMSMYPLLSRLFRSDPWVAHDGNVRSVSSLSKCALVSKTWRSLEANASQSFRSGFSSIPTEVFDMHLGMAGSYYKSSFWRSIDRTGPLKKPDLELNPLTSRRL
jgi:hypothetical protein